MRRSRTAVAVVLLAFVWESAAVAEVPRLGMKDVRQTVKGSPRASGNDKKKGDAAGTVAKVVREVLTNSPVSTGAGEGHARRRRRHDHDEIRVLPRVLVMPPTPTVDNPVPEGCFGPTIGADGERSSTADVLPSVYAELYISDGGHGHHGYHRHRNYPYVGEPDYGPYGYDGYGDPFDLFDPYGYHCGHDYHRFHGRPGYYVDRSPAHALYTMTALEAYGSPYQPLGAGFGLALTPYPLGTYLFLPRTQRSPGLGWMAASGLDHPFRSLLPPVVSPPEVGFVDEDEGLSNLER